MEGERAAALNTRTRTVISEVEIRLRLKMPHK